jgi:hypothetical protein
LDPARLAQPPEVTARQDSVYVVSRRRVKIRTDPPKSGVGGGNHLVKTICRVVAVLLAVTGLTSIGVVATWGAESTAASPSPSKVAAPTARPAPEVSDPLHVTINDLYAVFRQSASDVFAGIEVTPDQQGIVIHVLDSGRARVQQIVDQRRQALGSQALPADKVAYVSATESLASLQSRQDQLTRAFASLEQQGVKISSYYPDIVNNTLDVTVQAFKQGDQDAIAQAIGNGNLIVTEGADATPYSRATDSYPWFGGDWISSSTDSCTSGFSMVDSSGVTYNSSAAHCDTTAGHNDTFKQNGQGYGVTVRWERCNNCVGDSELISTYPGSSDGYVWQTNSATSRVGTVDTGQQVAGESMCADGYYTFLQIGNESCGGTIVASNVCVTFDIVVCGLIKATKSSVIAQPGDSGGPIYNHNADGSLNARGLVTGGPCSGSCTTVYYTQIATPMFLFGVSVITR